MPTVCDYYLLLLIDCKQAYFLPLPGLLSFPLPGLVVHATPTVGLHYYQLLRKKVCYDALLSNFVTTPYSRAAACSRRRVTTTTNYYYYYD